MAGTQSRAASVPFRASAGIAAQRPTPMTVIVIRRPVGSGRIHAIAVSAAK
jgi:hypothetical protein